jgi:hypothetical protein
MTISSNKDKKKVFDKYLYGCPTCHLSRYVILSENIQDVAYHKYELYCHSCNVVFSPMHAVLPMEFNHDT